ncbi:4-hydroxy-tetrahydrodipicolinate synthase [Alcaligenaceae bacterium A4P071]|nr:4-hydroxy-tetrahydrodipicolinate synthase [Alcaligenaceae bacterium A4P071]
MPLILEGIWIPIVTPFRDDAIDHAALAALARHLAESGITGFVAGATTGEGALLSIDEQAAVLHTLRHATPDLPVVLGVSSPSTAMAAHQARTLSALRPDGLLVTPPSYVRPTQLGVQKHFEAVADAAPHTPIIVYSIPYRTGVTVEVETLQTLAQQCCVVGIKECGGDLTRMLRLIHETPLQVLSGDDGMNFSALCLGAHGTIAASAHILPHWHVRMHELLRQGALARARRIAVALHPITQLLFAEPNPSPLKALLAESGHIASDVRLPFMPVSDALRGRLVAALAALENDEAVMMEHVTGPS